MTTLCVAHRQCRGFPSPREAVGRGQGGGAAARTAQRVNALVAKCHLWIAASLCTGCALPAVAAIISQGICSHQPRSLEGAPEASVGGARCGACAFVPCKHGARAARGPPWGITTPRD